MTNAVLEPPMHPRKQVKRLEHMSKNYHNKTSCAQQLQEGAGTLSYEEQDYRTRKQHAQWHQHDQCFKQCEIHIDNGWTADL